MSATTIAPMTTCMTRRQGLAALAALMSCTAVAQGQWQLPQVPDVSLQDQDSRTWKLRTELSHAVPMVLSFMFTSCATTCPPQTAALRELRRTLNTDPALRSVLMLSITVDPVADGPMQLKAYAQRYDINAGRDQGWLFLTGDRVSLAKTWRAFGVEARSPDAHPSLLWIAHASRERWTRSSALNAPTDLMRAVREVVA